MQKILWLPKRSKWKEGEIKNQWIKWMVVLFRSLYGLSKHQVCLEIALNEFWWIIYWLISPCFFFFCSTKFPTQKFTHAKHTLPLSHILLLICGWDLSPIFNLKKKERRGAASRSQSYYINQTLLSGSFLMHLPEVTGCFLLNLSISSKPHQFLKSVPRSKVLAEV